MPHTARYVVELKAQALLYRLPSGVTAESTGTGRITSRGAHLFWDTEHPASRKHG
jgi:hypothetical protein